MKVHGRGGKSGKQTKEQQDRVRREKEKKEKLAKAKAKKIRKLNRSLEEAVKTTKEQVTPKSLRVLQIITQWEKERSKPKELINIYKLAVDRWQHEKVLEILRNKLKNIVREEEYNSVHFGCLNKEDKEKIIKKLIGSKPSQKEVDELIKKVEKYKGQVERLTKR